MSVTDQSVDLLAQYEWLAGQFRTATQQPFDEWAAQPHLDNRRGVTVIGRFSSNTAAVIGRLLHRLRASLPRHLTYPDASIHISLVVPVPAGVPARVEPDAYLPAVPAAVEKASEFSIELRGVSVAGSAVILRGFPVGDTFEWLRASLRLEFARRGLPNLEKIVACYDGKMRPRCTAHVTLARLACVDDSIEQSLRPYVDVSCGMARVRTIALVRHDEFLTPEKCCELYTARLLGSALAESEA